MSDNDVDRSREAQFRSEGWAWGTTDGGEWLTVAGSALYSTYLALDPARAVPPPPIIGHPHVLARVRRHGTHFEILEMAPQVQQHVLITATDDRYGHLVTGWCSCSTWEFDHYTRSSVFTGGWRFCGSARPVVVEHSYQRGHANKVALAAAVTG